MLRNIALAVLRFNEFLKANRRTGEEQGDRLSGDQPSTAGCLKFRQGSVSIHASAGETMRVRPGELTLWAEVLNPVAPDRGRCPGSKRGFRFGI
jgi:hypothetical protein